MKEKMKDNTKKDERDKRRIRRSRDQEKMKLNCLINCPPSEN